ncbi:MAG: sigma-70 family RNA polymerase sigma factor [Smithella sp.]
MSLIAEGDNEAFTILIRRHQDHVLNLIYRFFKDRDQAEDLAQEVFVRVWQGSKSYRATAKFSTWLYRITANLCLDEIKSIRYRLTFLSIFNKDNPSEIIEETNLYIDHTPSPEELIIDREENDMILNFLQALPVNQRMAFILKRFENLSYEEISQTMECSVSSVESLLVRAKKTLQKKIAHQKK